jgi:hypothetical protein
MHQTLKNLYSGFAILLFLFLAIASNPSKKTFSNGEKWIPKDFDPTKTTLLIQKFRSSEKQQTKMEGYMEEKYPYKYEFVSTETIIEREGKYADTDIYRYALRITSHTTTYTNSNMVTSGFDFYFYDRANDIKYPASNKASSYIFTTFQPVINTILKKYE